MGVDMSMDKIARRIFVNKPSKTFKSSMTPVFGVMDVPWRRMGDNDIDTAHPPNLGTQTL